MKYIAIEFRIPCNQTKNSPMTFEEINRSIRYTRAFLGNNYIDISNGKHRLDNIQCPICNTLTQCFITEEDYSADNRKRILQATCTDCKRRFYTYQESIDEQSLN